ncbi:WD40/YVTN/BNR-like repeat-containing protein [Massilia niastensis]|uniref:WD40/YVTN/BNR-like repeat-containing protein n=1 Tax=Massilia niastensis TaxID=544911 RepID=UPI00036ACA61|nr:YCF48-related protein [Massilia niastensis]
MRFSLARACLAAACAALLPALPGAAIAATAAVPDRPASLSGPAVVLARAARPAAMPERASLLSVARAGRRLVAVGEHGVVALSDDNGAVWRNARAVPVDVTLTVVRFVNEKTGWAVGHIGVVLRTDDGGETWVKQMDGLAMDGSGEAPDRPLLELLVANERHLVAVGAYNLAIESQDGGATWRNIAGRFSNDGGFHLYGLVAAGEGLVAVGEQGLLLKSAAAGAPLSAVAFPYKGSLFGAIAPAPGSMLVYGLKGNAYLSNDKGASWRAADVGGSTATFNCALRLRDGRVALCDQAGRVFISDDGGQHFARLDFEWGAPLTAMAESADGDLLLASLGGMAKINKDKLARAARGKGGGHGR